MKMLCTSFKKTCIDLLSVNIRLNESNKNLLANALIQQTLPIGHPSPLFHTSKVGQSHFVSWHTPPAFTQTAYHEKHV